MGNVDEGASFNLAVTLSDPCIKASRIHVWMSSKSAGYGVDDVMEKISLIIGISIGTSKNDPIGAPGVQELNTICPEVVKEMTSGLAVSSGFSRNDALIHSLMVEGDYLWIQEGVDVWLKDRKTVEVDGEIDQPAGLNQGTEGWQRRGEVDQIEKGVGQYEIP